MSRADTIDYTPIGGTDDGEVSDGSGSSVAHFCLKYGSKIWWTIVGLATVTALAILVQVYGNGTIQGRSTAPGGNRTKDAVGLLNQTSFPISDVATRQVQNSGSPQTNRRLLQLSNMQMNVDDAMVKAALQYGATEQSKRMQQEDKMKAEGYMMNRYSPSGKHHHFLKPSAKAQKLANDGFMMDEASKFISKKLQMSKSDAQKGIRLHKPQEPCTPSFKTTLCMDLNSKTNVYRSTDGLCNNLNNPGWGAANQPFRRVLMPDYADGISSPRVSVDGSPLPNPRKISTVIHYDRKVDDSIASLLLPAFGQFIDHDITSTALGGGSAKGLSCCKDDKAVPEVHPECFPFEFEDDNELYTQHGGKCTNIWRSARFPSCEFGRREQFSQTTAFIDGSVIYGTSDEKIRGFRELNVDNPHGWLATYKAEDGRKLLPVSTDLMDGCNVPEQTDMGRFCFTSGDSRLNENIVLTAMHLLFTRQHNFIADKLTALNPESHDGKIFFEVREVIIAQLQHITYNEFLPVLLGDELMKKAGLKLWTDEYYTEYDDKVDATLSNAAYRMGHSMLQGLVKMMDNSRNLIESVPLHELLFNPFRLWNAGSLDQIINNRTLHTILIEKLRTKPQQIINGQATAAASKVDSFFTKELTHHLFENINGSLDLVSINIQRGRDHGIPGYTSWRVACGLEPVNDFSQLRGLWDEDTLYLTQSVYKSVHDIDLYSGMFAEVHLPGAMVGPTLGCLLADQFLRLKKGDRFWYEGNSRARPFTPEQLAMIRKTSLARIICDNGDNIKEIQARPLEKPSLNNPLLPCDSGSIPTLDYSLWLPNVESGLKPGKN